MFLNCGDLRLAIQPHVVLVMQLSIVEGTRLLNKFAMGDPRLSIVKVVDCYVKMRRLESRPHRCLEQFHGLEFCASMSGGRFVEVADSMKSMCMRMDFGCQVKMVLDSRLTVVFHLQSSHVVRPRFATADGSRAASVGCKSCSLVCLHESGLQLCTFFTWWARVFRFSARCWA